MEEQQVAMAVLSTTRLSNERKPNLSRPPSMAFASTTWGGGVMEATPVPGSRRMGNLLSQEDQYHLCTYIS